MYDPSYYKSTSQTEKGLAVTHEQASDVYVEGTNDGNIDEKTRENNV
ncbi:YozQ family protein [uncultured Brevibacillus sp.]|nr:YozQ family protein [uncultured Brevibacillus sp.]